MENAPPQLVFFHGKKMEKQVLIDVSGRNTVGKVGELANRQILKPTNLADWLILQVTDSLFFRTIKWIVSYGELINVIREIFNPPDHREVELKKNSPTRIQLCLWNPVTLQSIDLPVIEIEFRSKDRIGRVLITSNPNFPDCLVLVFLNKSILYWDLNGADKCWTRVDYPDAFFARVSSFQDLEFALVKDSNSIVVQTGFRSKYPIAIVVIEKNPRRLVIRPYQRETPQLHSICAPGIGHKTYHVECRGNIFFIDVCYGGVLRHKEDLVGDEVMSIVVSKVHPSFCFQSTLSTCPDAAFFISGDQVLCFPTSNAGEGNRVYMVLENKDRKLLCTYHIEKKTMSRSLLPSLPDCTTPPYWISGFPSAPPLGKVDENFSATGETKNVLGKTLNDLPFDILKDISTHLLNPVDYLNFRATNKLCRSVAGSAKEWRSTSPCIISTSLLLMIPSLQERGVSFMVDPVSGSKYNLNTCWGQNRSTICSASQGWLLMYNDSLMTLDEITRRRVKLRLYNPITKSTDCLTEYLTAGFFLTHSNVVGIPRFCMIVLNRKESKYRWNSGEIIKEDGVQNIHVNQSNINPACIEGRDYYFLVGDGDLASYHHDQGNVHLRVHHLKLPCSDCFEQRFIVAAYNDVILSVYVGKEWQWLRVYEFDRSKMAMEWVEVEDLGNHNVYLSTVSCICKEAAFPAKGNRIYLPRFHGGRIVYYSLDTRKFQAGEGDSSVVVSYCDSEEQLHMSCWFEPSLALCSFSDTFVCP